MRINKFVAGATGMSRRAADSAIASGQVTINGVEPAFGQEVGDKDIVVLDGQTLSTLRKQTILLNKPAGYICSRDGQGGQTVYDLLPENLHNLKSVGRLDKDSSGLLLLTNDGDLTQQLTHPSHHKVKIYEIRLDAPLQPLHRQMINDIGIQLEDGPSRLQIDRVEEANDRQWRITMHEGRNRQIRRTFSALGYTVTRLHRSHFGPYNLVNLEAGKWREVTANPTAKD